MMRLLALLLVVLLPSAAEAHRLRVFAAAEAQGLAGHAFFVGGGRAAGAALTIVDAAGAVVFTGTTGPDGAFRWTGPGAGFVVTVNAGDGHVATARVGLPDVAAAPLADPLAATLRQEIAPLLARIDALEHRLWFTDIVAGVFLLIGGAGGLLWATGRRT